MKKKMIKEKIIAGEEGGCCSSISMQDPCCEQPTDGSPCCNKEDSKEINAEKTGCC